MNLGSGKIKINSSIKHLLWTGQRAQHVAENFNAGNNLLHVEIQQAAQKSRIFIKESPGQIIAIYEQSDGTIIIPLEIKGGIAMIKTAHKNKATAQSVVKHKKRISGTVKEIPQYLTAADVESYKDEIVNYLGLTVERYLEVVNLGMHKLQLRKKRR